MVDNDDIELLLNFTRCHDEKCITSQNVTFTGKALNVYLDVLKYVEFRAVLGKRASAFFFNYYFFLNEILGPRSALFSQGSNFEGSKKMFYL